MAFSHVLIPTDFSEPASNAFRHAIEEATLHRARVTLLHVLGAHSGTDVFYVTGEPESLPQGSVDPVVGRRFVGSSTPPTVVRRDPAEEALTRLQDLARAAFSGAWEAEVAVGHPAETIVRVARERGADLIVMGTHGRTGLQHVLLGSVTEHVVRLASCPVLTIRHPAHS